MREWAARQFVKKIRFDKLSARKLPTIPWFFAESRQMYIRPARLYLLLMPFAKIVGNEIFVICIMQNYLHNTWWSPFLFRCEPLDAKQKTEIQSGSSLLYLGFTVSPFHTLIIDILHFKLAQSCSADSEKVILRLGSSSANKTDPIRMQMSQSPICCPQCQTAYW